jgi:hypothetical protein
MKALRIKRVDHILANRKAVFRFLLYNGDELLLGLPCDEFQFEKFKWKWERFQVNEDYYFDLSDWIL